MTESLAPKSHDDVLDAIRWAVAEEAPLEIVGGGTKRGWGRPPATNHVLDLSALAGIRLYEPEELILQASAATPLAEVEALLAENGQQLAFEPPDLGPLFGRPAGRQTLGGAIVANLAGPRRIKAGAARDHFLGFAGVSGRGETFKSGGRVMKNVTGYDLCKLMAGSFGTLAVLSEVTVKVLPAGEKTRTVLVYGLEDGPAVEAMAAALNSSHEVSGAAHLPAGIAARSAVGYVCDAGAAVTAVRVEGPGPSVEHRCAALRDLLAEWGATEELHGRNSAALWAEVRDVSYFAGDTENAVWRLSAPPAAPAGFLNGLAEDLDADWFADWGGGL
ncbi:MAG: FAD-binding protein, partial [Rhodospirillaceae bacterium]|nr:FAD-binding protein [Rhodospirillaceae bacterium]